MNKKLVLVIALSFVLASGAFASARADCGCFHLPSLCGLSLNPCGWHLPSCFTCGGNTSARDVDKPLATKVDTNKAFSPAGY